jgi:hypothetical protein
MIYTQLNLTPNPTYPTYPPYHTGDYLEDYFRNKFILQNPNINRDFIGISWTTLYCQGPRDEIQPFLDSLPRDKKYFTVSQHDDAPSHKLPKDTLCFSAGGNVQGSNIIPIPLVCSKMPINITENDSRPLLASFVGSMTHPIRNTMAEACKSNKNIAIYMKGWNPTVAQNELEFFINLASNSKFCLCPRGYGLNSFRLYEAMQLGCIPVIITDKFYLPWSDELDWKEFSVLIHSDQISNIENILLSYSDDQIKDMKNKIKTIYGEYFTLDGMYNNILKRI